MTHFAKTCAPRRPTTRRQELGLNIELLEPRMTPAVFGPGDVPTQPGAAPIIGNPVAVQQPVGQPSSATASGTSQPGVVQPALTTFNSGSANSFSFSFATFGSGVNSTDPGFSYPSFAEASAAFADPYSRIYRVPAPSNFDPLSRFLYRLPPPNNLPPQNNEFTQRQERLDEDLRSMWRVDQRLDMAEHAFVNIYKVTNVDGQAVVERVALLAMDEGDVGSVEAALQKEGPGRYRVTLEDRSGESLMWEGTMPIESNAARASLQDALKSIRNHIELLKREDQEKLNEAPLPPREEKPTADQSQAAWSDQVERLAALMTWVDFDADDLAAAGSL